MITAPTINELIGIYDADGTAIGELRYVIGRLRGAHCSLCDITHGAVRERADWRAARASLPVPLVAVHRNESPIEVRSKAGQLPAVVVKLVDGSIRPLLGAGDIDGLAGDPIALVEAIRRRADALDLRWPDPNPRPAP